MRNRKKQWLAVLLATALLISGSYMPAKAQKTQMQTDRKQTTEKAKTNVSRYGIGDVPSAFNWRDLGKVTPVKNQSPTNACWAFSAVACMEQNILKQELRGCETVDLSESQLGYAIFSNSETSLPGLEGDRVIYEKNIPWYVHGGNNIFTLTMLMRGTGPVAESFAPFEAVADGLPDAVTFRMGDYEVKGVFTYAGNDKDGIKDAICQYGGVTMPVHIENSKEVRSGNTSVYLSEEARALAEASGNKIEADHEVCVVGWDDAYSCENFNGEKPVKNGAWLCKNSYGTGWGDEGYFWLSYEDVISNNKDNVCFAFEMGEANTNETIYQYDGGGSDDSISAVMVANVFTARSTEKLTAVRVRNMNDMEDATIYIYTDVDPSDPESGTMALEMQDVSFSRAGYESIELDEPVIVGQGQRFSVCIEYKQTAKVGIDCGRRYQSVGLNFDVTANAGESFYKKSEDSDWIDLNDSTKEKRNYNLRIKAVAQPLGTKSLQMPKLEAVKTAAGNIRLKWSEVEAAQGYLVYRAVEQGEYELVGSVDELSTSYLCTNLTPGVTYRYYVAAYADGYEVSESPIRKVKGTILPPSNFTLAQKNGIVTIRWSKVKNAAGYRIYRRARGGKYVLLAAVSNVKTYKDRTVKRGGTYYYKIKAEAGTTLSAFSTCRKIKVN